MRASIGGIRDLDDPGSEEGSGEAGTAIGGALLLDLPEAPLSVSAFQPTSGQSVALEHRQGGRGTSIELEPFRHDVLIRLTVDEA